MKTSESLVKRAQQILSSVIFTDDIVLDATAGNGYDSEFLATKVGKKGHVYSFDIQPQAIEKTRVRLTTGGLMNQVHLIQSGHELATRYIDNQHTGKIKAVMFNLGYLPGGDKSITTQTENVIAALTNLHSIVHLNAVISIIAYTGHEGGREQTDAIKYWLTSQENHLYHATFIKPDNANPNTPELFVLRLKII